LRGNNIEFDVIIVGAGPAGSTAAKILSGKGYKILLLDKEKFPRDKPCGGGIPQRVIRRFPYIMEDNIIEDSVYGGIAHTPDLNDEVKLEKDAPIGATIIRQKFDNHLLQLALKNGAVLKEKKLVTDIKILEDKANVFTDDGSSFESKIVIGADGIQSIVAKKIGLANPKRNPAVCIFEEIQVDSNVLDSYFGKKKLTHIYMKFQGINGYGWIFPKKHHLNLGICAFSLHEKDSNKKINLKELYYKYIKILNESKVIPNDLAHDNIKGGQFPLYPLEKTFANRVILCGDAAGFINPFSGEGIYYAMSSAEIGAKLIDKALSSGKADEDFLCKYEKMWKKDFGRDIKQYYMVGKKQRERTHKLVDIIKKDKIFADIVFGILLGDKSIYEYRWKLRKRFIYASIKNIFSKGSN
jgi:geranylgeranyl reductase family protein